MSPTVSVVIACFNAEETLGRCLDALLTQDHPAVEVIVVDDGSTDRSLSVARDRTERGPLTILATPRNLGCAHARNVGMRRATGDIVAFIDADGFAAHDWLTEVVARFGDPSVGGTASTVLLNSRPELLNGAGGTLDQRWSGRDLGYEQPLGDVAIKDEVLYAMGCGMAFRRVVIDRVGEFDEAMVNYYDDVDYCIRVWRAGYRVVTAPKARIRHVFEWDHSAGKAVLTERHRIRLVLKHASWRALPAWAVRELINMIFRPSPHGSVKQDVIRWQISRLPDTVRARRRLRGAGPVPMHLFDGGRPSDR